MLKRTDLKLLLNSSFTFTEVGAGASDAIGRMGLAYDILTSLFNIEFRLPKYQNYHSPEIDFLELFGLIDAFPASIIPTTPRRHEVQRFSTFLERFIDQRIGLEDGVDYIFVPDIYRQDTLVNEFRKINALPNTFMSRLSYSPLSKPFLSLPGSKKVVVHLRRQDICGSALSKGLAAEDIPIHIRNWGQHRELLTIDRAVQELERSFQSGTSIQLIVSSDGIAEARKRLSHLKFFSDRLDMIEAELYAQPTSSALEIHVVEKIVGTGKEETRRSLDAMFDADLVITASSNFPKIICHIGKVELRVLDLEGTRP